MTSLRHGLPRDLTPKMGRTVILPEPTESLGRSPLRARETGGSSLDRPPEGEEEGVGIPLFPVEESDVEPESVLGV